MMKSIFKSCRSFAEHTANRAERRKSGKPLSLMLTTGVVLLTVAVTPRVSHAVYSAALTPSGATFTGDAASETLSFNRTNVGFDPVAQETIFNLLTIKAV
jgi:hypothetical protein